MTALDLDSDNVFQAEMTVESARQYFDGEGLTTDAETKLDEAQGAVHSGQFREAFVVIRIVP